jgi:hypothetical protein
LKPLASLLVEDLNTESDMGVDLDPKIEVERSEIKMIGR